MKITPILVVEEIEPCLPFWVDRMGFQNVAEMPDGDRIGFVMLVHEGVELMLESVACMRKDIPAFAPANTPRSALLYILVDDFADTLKRLEGYPLVMSERITPYGMREIGVYEPGGNIVMFAIKV